MEDTYTLSKEHDYSNARIPWYKKPENIPAKELEEAEALSRAISTKDSEHEWRMRHYKWMRIGFGWNVRCYYPWFMDTHEDAMQFVRSMCDHTWGAQTNVGDKYIYLGTYDYGYNHTCSKCGRTEYVRTSFNNYSGD